MAKRDLDQINYDVLRLLTRYKGKTQYYSTSWIANKLGADYKNTKDILLRMERQGLIERLILLGLPSWGITEAGRVLVKFYIKTKLFSKEKSGGKHLQDQRKRAHHPGDSDR